MARYTTQDYFYKDRYGKWQRYTGKNHPNRRVFRGRGGPPSSFLSSALIPRYGRISGIGTSLLASGRSRKSFYSSLKRY